MGWTVEDALGYRSRLIDGLDSIGERVDVIRQSPLSDLPTAIERLERILEVARDGMPCEAGVIEYGTDHDECVSSDYVWLTVDDDPTDHDLIPSDRVWLTVDDDPTEHGYISFDGVAEWLNQMGSLPAVNVVDVIREAIYNLERGMQPRF